MLTFSRNKYTDLYHARIPTLSAPADLSAGFVITPHTVAEVLTGRVGVPAA